MFAAAVFDPRHENFVVHIVSLENPYNIQEDDVYPFCRAQIAALMANKAPTLISTKYSDFADVFSPELALKLPEYIGIHYHAIELVNDWQLAYGPIYSLESVELEILKTYIQTNLANSFIKPYKSPAKAPIFIDKKPDESLWLYIDYWGLNNLTINN